MTTDARRRWRIALTVISFAGAAMLLAGLASVGSNRSLAVALTSAGGIIDLGATAPLYLLRERKKAA